MSPHLKKLISVFSPHFTSLKAYYQTLQLRLMSLTSSRTCLLSAPLSFGTVCSVFFLSFCFFFPLYCGINLTGRHSNHTAAQTQECIYRGLCNGQRYYSSLSWSDKVIMCLEKTNVRLFLSLGAGL